MEFAAGVEEALKLGESFTSDAEASAFWSEGAPDVACEELTYPGGAGQTQRVRLYRGGDAAAPTLLYIHGGGWTGGSIDLNEPCARRLAHGAPCNIVSISYRLAPAHPYPAAVMDCVAAAGWLRDNGAALGLNTGVVCVGGASAGANLALATALASPRGAFAGLALFYPVAGADFDTASYRDYADGPGLTRPRMQAMFDLYDPDRRRAFDPLVAPLAADNLDRLPPVCLIAAEHDVLRDDSVNLAAALQKAQVPTKFHIEPGVTHGFINRGRLVPSANVSIDRVATFISRLPEGEKVR